MTYVVLIGFKWTARFKIVTLINTCEAKDDGGSTLYVAPFDREIGAQNPVDRWGGIKLELDG